MEVVEKKDNTVDELSKMMEGLRIQISKLGQQSQHSGDGASLSKAKPTLYGCMYCDSKDHIKRECTALSMALREQWVKFAGEPGIKKISFFDTGEPVPLNGNKGGMKVLVEKHLREREAAMVAATHEANVYNNALQCTRRDEKPQNMSEADKKRLAEQIRRKSGWDALVLITSITAEVGAAWETI